MKVIERLLELQELEMGPRAGSPETRSAAETLRKEIPAPILGHYDRLLARGKKGVAVVRHGVCTGCQMKLATGIHAALLRGEDISMCDNCARYLLPAPEVPSAPTVAAGAGRKPAASKPPGKRGRKKMVPEVV